MLTHSSDAHRLHTRLFGGRGVILWAAFSLLVGQPAFGQLVISEVMADNGSTLLPNNDITDFVEIRNNSSNAVSLYGWSLSDQITNANRFVLPGNASVPAGGYLMVYCDSATNMPGLHSRFGLDRNGSFVGLFFNGNLRDYVNFGLQLEDYSIGRYPTTEADAEFTLNEPTPHAANVAAPLGDPTRLRINEWMALSTTTTGADTNADWFEIYNPDTNVVTFDRLYLTDSGLLPVTNPPIRRLSFINPQAFRRFIADDVYDPYGRANHVNFKLSSTFGDWIVLYQSNGPTAWVTIDVVNFGPQTANVSQGRLPDGSTNIVSMPGKATPGESNLIPLTNSIVINEVLAHTDPPFEDAIEIYNPTARYIDISGWWLSNERDNPYKYGVPEGTVLAPFGYKVFYENDFNPNRTGVAPEFTLNSAHGDRVYLYQTTPSSALTGFFRGADVGPSANAISYGRYVTPELKADFVPLVRPTLGTSVQPTDPPGQIVVFRTGRGASNSQPIVGPLVINEIMYHPPDVLIDTNRFDDSTNEFVEILNISATNVTLFDNNVYSYADGRTNAWRVRGSIEYTFPPGLTLAPLKMLLLVNFDPNTNANNTALFRQRYNIPSDVRIFGPYRGKLGNRNGVVELQRPDIPQGPQHPDFRYVPYLESDRIRYSDVAPWPVSPDGWGHSLQRKYASRYGNDAYNWVGLAPSAGRLNPASRPVITQQPRNTTVRPGDAVSLRVVANGTEPLAFQWHFNGSELAGRTNASIDIGYTIPENAGQYFVVISNIVGLTTSAVATLTVDCGFVFVQPTVALPARGGTTNGQLTAGAGCLWWLINTNTWITVHDDSTNGVGSGLIYFDAPTNTTGRTRVGYLRVAGKSLKVVQYAPERARPTVAFTAPLPNAITTNSILSVRGVASDETELADVLCSVAGQPLQPVARITKTSPRLWSWSNSVALEPGTNVVYAQSTDLAGNVSPLVPRRFVRRVKQLLSVQIVGNGSVTPNLNGANLNIGQNYTLTATPRAGFVFSNWTAGATVLSTRPMLTFMMQSNLQLTATFVPNPFPAVAGTYTGLFSDTNEFLQEHAGFFAFTLTANGGYSGNLQSLGKAALFTGKLDLDGHATNRVRLGPSWLTVEWWLDLGVARADRLAGTVLGSNWLAALWGDRAWFHAVTNPAPFAGKYTFAITGITDTAIQGLGHGFGTATMTRAGACSLAGALADNAALVRAGRVSRYGEFPLYLSLYGGRGSVIGWMHLTSAAPARLSGDLRWTRPPLPLPAGRLYPAGFTNDSMLVGDAYQPPAGVGNRVLSFENGVFRFSEGNLAAPFANFVTLTTNNQIRNRTDLNSNALTATLALPSGTFSGQVRPPSGGAAIPFRGGLLQGHNFGLGFFVGTNQSGPVRFEAAP